MSGEAEAIVLGGGAAGAAAAIGLARAGRRVLLVEREAAPREKVCGEFLGADAAALLSRLGLDLAALGAVPVRRARLAHARRVAEIALPFAAWGLPRRVLDEALLAAAAASGAVLLRGRAGQAATPAPGGGWALRLADGETLSAAHLVLATGKHELRGLARAAPRRGAIGLKLHLRLAVPLEGVALLLGRQGGYAGLQPTAAGLANLCVALPAAMADVAAAARDAAALLAHVAAGSELAAALLDGAVPAQPRPLAVARIPYGFLHRDTAGAPRRLWRIGDQLAVIPSFSGDGVAMALAGGIGAARAIAAGAAAPAFHAAWRRRLASPMRLAGVTAALLGRMPAALVAVSAGLPVAARQVACHTRLPREVTD